MKVVSRNNYVETQPVPVAPQQPVQLQPAPAPMPAKPPKKKRGCCCGCLTVLGVIFALLIVLLVLPTPIKFVILGVDRAPDGSATGRTDTNIIVGIYPLKPTVNMLSIPRDLWVSIPGVGENRINTAHFFAEANRKGSGPAATLDTIEANFGLRIRYYARVQFEGVVDIVDAMGGVKVTMPEDMSGYSAGDHVLDGTQALAFARDRSGTDDFFRMNHGQLLIKSMFTQMLNPVTWPRIPAVILASSKFITTNIPVWEWPRIGFALLRAGAGGIDNRTIDRSMVNGWTTDQGAQVLLPNWDAINPVVRELFGN